MFCCVRVAHTQGVISIVFVWLIAVDELWCVPCGKCLVVVCCSVQFLMLICGAFCVSSNDLRVCVRRNLFLISIGLLKLSYHVSYCRRCSFERSSCSVFTLDASMRPSRALRCALQQLSRRMILRITASHHA